MERLFCSEERGTDVVKWAREINALAGAMALLFFYDDDTIGAYGEMLMQIICDYSKAIEETIGKVECMLNKHFKGESLSRDLADKLRYLEKIRNWNPKVRLNDARDAINEGREFLEEASRVQPILRRIEELATEAEMELAERNKKASADPASQTEALSNTGQMPRSDSSIAN